MAIRALAVYGARNGILRLALGCRMTVRQFAKLPPDRQQAVHRAYLTLMSQPEPEPADNDAMALPRGRWSTDLKIKVGCWQMHMKATPPHGHFGRGSRSSRAIPVDVAAMHGACADLSGAQACGIGRNLGPCGSLLILRVAEDDSAVVPANFDRQYSIVTLAGREH
ncbi:hypothetical protein CK219_03490 [Mesorhizobium sp. WSM4313]|nr:hypothetical protein CK219_03490 [Mesorhizobium sp. WSM4313]